MQINDFLSKKQQAKKIKMVTCYDYWSAKIIAKTDIDAILVGDSLSMVMYGASSTIEADADMMVYHTRSVANAKPGKFIVTDLPFLSYRKSISKSMIVIDKIMKAGANAVKLEGVSGNESIIKHIVESGVPVMGHLGFTPQSVNMFGKNIVQGKNTEQANQLKSDALKLEELGCFAVVLECIPDDLALDITNSLNIPTIGIGAGMETAGQILVLHDLIGADDSFNPKFLKKYSNIDMIIKNAIDEYCYEVDSNIFPSKDHSYKL